MLSLWLLHSFSLSGEKEGWVIGLRGRPDRQMPKKTFPTICLTEKVRLWEQEKGLTKWAHTFSSSSSQSPANSRCLLMIMMRRTMTPLWLATAAPLPQYETQLQYHPHPEYRYTHLYKYALKVMYCQ
jgi:hypothetical protein